MPSDVSGTIVGLDALVKRLDQATEAIVSDAAHLFQAQAMENAPVGEAENSTNPSGDLRRSIHVEGPTGSDGIYTARVGPTVSTVNPGPGGSVFNYGRQREFGGTLEPKASKALAFNWNGQVYFRASVYQEGRLYLTRARASKEADVEMVIEERLTVAVTGG